MPTDVRCKDGTIWVDDRLTIDEWVVRTQGPEARLLGLALSGEELIATVALPETVFPFQNVKVHFSKVPDDVLFELNQVTEGEFMQKYFADRDKSGRRVYARLGTRDHEETRELLPERSLGLVNHSPDGFEWSYAGSGPMQLAYAMLLDIFDDEALAGRHYQDFGMRFISNLPVARWEIREDDVRQWIANAEKGELL